MQQQSQTAITHGNLGATAIYIAHFVTRAATHEDWQKLHDAYRNLYKIDFDRLALESDKTYGLHVCCDSSNVCYGFVAYAANANSCNYIFSKNKVAPMQALSIPTLEFMSVVLALKCLGFLLSGHEIKF